MPDFLEGAEPFLLQGGKRGVLLIHGFTGCPSEMRLLGGFLHESGYTVLAPRLCGHGTRPEELASTTWINWYHSVCDAYYVLKSICEEISVVGLSMGGLLAISLAAAHGEIKNVIALSCPIEILDRKLLLLPPAERAAGRYVLKRRRKFTDDAEKYSVFYSKTPLMSIHHLLKLIESAKEKLPRLNSPFLVIHSKSDHTAAPSSAEYLYNNCGSKEKELFWLEKSGHLITLDQERETAFRKIRSFLS